ncbi:MAG: Holliday junction resolvase RuvX [Nitrospira sp.]|nr:MAG: putative holliday junction resolvase [Nitrospira sp. OLB3]MCE7964503.1 Holliday junction resolvase RuvX [Nitrospira sp. NTP2]MCK6492439.1 Holliday junction resolvase RuvX [Nitrospira sp.]MEB2339702.1 Holliday junction resolvase RuvX [Nitrospirales bacterium]QOJ34085.1 MAG: Holliday junction resolvase RuvX [Nitrospira sp.]
MKGRRILAIDHGAKRIGFALSDELGWTAQPLETLHRKNLESDLRHIQQLVRDHDVGMVLVGMPFKLDGELGPAAKVVEAFIQTLSPMIPVPVVTWDERMTTRSAEEVLIAADVSRRKRKGIVDRVAAAILLQSYLASVEEPSVSVSEGIPNECDAFESVSGERERVDDAETNDGRADPGRGAADGHHGISRAAMGAKPRR